MKVVEKRRLRKRDCVGGLFERNGRATNLAEGSFHHFCGTESQMPITEAFVRLPVAGYLVAAIHVLKGNKEHARRAAGRSTNFL